MGKRRFVQKNQSGLDHALKERSLSKLVKRKLLEGVLYIESTYNNTRLTLTDNQGGVLAWSTAGALGYKGAKKGTPLAAQKVAEILGEKAKIAGIQNVSVIVKGVGAGRESAIRGFIFSGINLTSIQDQTPIPHNGPKPKKPRRV